MSASLDRRQRYKAKPADWTDCPVCGRHWQRTQQQRTDGSRCCSPACVVRQGNMARAAKARREAASRYRQAVRARLVGRAVLDVAEIVALMLDARREGITLGMARNANRLRALQALREVA